MFRKKIKVNHYNNEMPKFNKIEVGDWIDVRANEVYICNNNKEDINRTRKNKINKKEWINNKVSYKKGDVVFIRLGFAMELPKNYEAEVKPRSSTFENYGLILTNSVGCIDNSYRGDKDEWSMMYYATRDGAIEQYERVGQFRINKKMPKLSFQFVKLLGNENRGGYGSTGTK